MTIRSRYSNMDDPGVTFTEPSLTEQSHEEDTNVNKIMAKYQQTGVCHHIAKYGPTYGDYDSVTFTRANNVVAQGESMFAELPSKARDYFDNNPTKFMQYMEENPDVSVLAELGLALRREDEPSANGPSCPPQNQQAELSPSESENESE